MQIVRIENEAQPIWAEQHEGKLFRLEGSRFDRPARGAYLGMSSSFRVLAPIEAANKIVALLGNFMDRGARKGPGFFFKPPSAVIGLHDAIVRPPGVTAFNFEAEIGVVVGRRARSVPASRALDYVLGYTVVNDITSFPLMEEDGGLSTRWKSYDTFCPMGPCIVTGLDPNTLHLRARLNGVVKQDVDLSSMTFGVAETVAWVSAAVTLEPGDVISMGTPPGFAELNGGDVIECSIEGIGVLCNTVSAVAASSSRGDPISSKE